ncbi:unnamed protein product [Acanthosepion pharaonis]|uniref:Uncharacterized protein n=1 Tax=Acanthosepion pharaonis TaxID=158019 RepID=A0A812C5G3_ACAPH|nr:unnamed protein product [Sepia pharaonis]
MSQLYSFKAVEDSFQQPNNNASGDDFMLSQLYSFKAEDSFQQPNNPSETTFVPALFLQGCRRFLSATKWAVKVLSSNQMVVRLSCQLYSFKAVEDSFQQPNGNASERLHVPLLFLQGCRRFLSTTNNNASETTSCPSFIPSKAVEVPFQQPNNNASETTSCPSFIPSRL